MSTELTWYLNFLVSFETPDNADAATKAAGDAIIDDFIEERKQFILIGQSPDIVSRCNSSIDSVFNEIDSLAKQLHDKQVEDQTVQNEMEAAKNTSIFTGGLSMDAYLIFQGQDRQLRDDIGNKERELNEHLDKADTDVANGVGGSMQQFIGLFKKNNAHFIANTPKDLTIIDIRSYLYTFMGYIDRNAEGGLTRDSFKKYVHVARITKDDAQISKIGQILDEFMSSDKGEAKAKEALKDISSSGIPDSQVGIVSTFTYVFWMEKGVSYATVQNAVKGGIESGVLSGAGQMNFSGIFESMHSLIGFTSGITVMLSTVSSAINLFKYTALDDKYNKQSAALQDAKNKCKQYFQALYDAATKYDQLK